MAATAVTSEPSKVAVSTSLDNSGIGTGTGPPTGTPSRTPVSVSAKQQGEVHVFGILQHTGLPVQDDVPGLYRDGRVRNPVPSKLKGMTDSSKGNFGVMHIDLPTANETRDRVAAAKRTSEGTQLAAKLAQTDRYVGFKRSKYVSKPADQVAPNPPKHGGYQHRTLPLTVAETKAEQARLLVLLRNLSPALVVDQICKALAFFGGVSDAQPLVDEAFPHSAEANGSGSLFVGWLAEIFPALGQGSIPSAQHPPLRRPRGRPKGSKNAKGKKDKLARRRFGFTVPSASAIDASCAGGDLNRESVADESWIDVEDGVAGDDGESPDEKLVHDSTTPSHNSKAMVDPSASGSMLGEAATVTPTPKRRGRPKGSKNRPKNKAMLNDGTLKTQDAVLSTTTCSISSAQSSHAEPGLPGVKKRKPGPGRPKGSKNRPKEPAPTPNHDPQSPPASTNIDHEGTEVQLDALEGVSQPSTAIDKSITLHPPAHSASESLSEATVGKPNAGGGSQGIKRKRKTTDGGRTNAPDATPTALAPNQSLPEAVAAFASQGGSPPQITGYNDPLNQYHMNVYRPAKRQKFPAAPRQEPKMNSQPGQAGQATQPEPHEPQTNAPADHHNDNLSGTGGSNLQRPRKQVSVSANQSTLQQASNNQQSHVQPSIEFKHTATLATGQQAEIPTVAGSHTTNMPGRTAQGMYEHGRLAQSQNGQQRQRQQQQQQQRQQQQRQQQQRQQQRQLHQQQQQQNQRQQQLCHQPHNQKPQQSSKQDRSNVSPHRLPTPNAGQAASAAGHDGNSYITSTGDGDYNGLASVRSSFDTQMIAPLTAPDVSYRGSTSRSMQHHSPSFQARQAHQSQSSGLPSFHDYSESSFLEMSTLDSASQASLNINPTSYDINGENMQRVSPNMNSSYRTDSGMGQTSFDGSMSESAIQERMYHTLRR